MRIVLIVTPRSAYAWPGTAPPIRLFLPRPTPSSGSRRGVVPGWASGSTDTATTWSLTSGKACWWWMRIFQAAPRRSWRTSSRSPPSRSATCSTPTITGTMPMPTQSGPAPAPPRWRISGVAEEMKRYEPARWQQAAQNREDVAAVGEDTVHPRKRRSARSRTCWREPAGGWSFITSGWPTRAVTAWSICRTKRSFARVTPS